MAPGPNTRTQSLADFGNCGRAVIETFLWLGSATNVRLPIIHGRERASESEPKLAVAGGRMVEFQ